MKRVCLIYFSPTGGTEKMARAAAEAISEKLALPLDVFDITSPKNRNELPCFSGEDFVVIAAPTYAGRIPNKLLPELQRLLSSKGSPCLCISVYGGRSNDEALRELVLLAEEKGFNVIAVCACVVRHSMSGALAAHRPSEKDFEDIRSFAVKAAEKVLKSSQSPVPIDRDAPIAPYYRPFKEDMSPAVFLKAKPLTHEDKCTACGICAQACPMGSISFEDFISVPGICIKCHACVRKCPTNAKYFADGELLSHIRILEKLFKGDQDNFYLI